MDVLMENKTENLSSSQLSMWLISKMNPGVPLYNDAFTIVMKERIDTITLQNALNTLIARHECLRTVFSQKEDCPYQTLVESFEFPLECFNVDCEDTAIQKMKEIMKLPFDLENGPLIRGAFFRIQDTGLSLLFIVSHHIILDGTSVFNIIVPELEALMNGTALDSVQRHYMDYTKWQKAVRQSEIYKKSLQYWKKQLCNVPTLALPTDREYYTNTYNGKRIIFSLPKSLINNLHELSNKEKTSFNNIIISAVCLLLYKYKKQKEIVLGTISSGRIIDDLDRIAGNFVNPLVLRFKMNATTVTDLLQTVSMASMDSYQNQIVSFDQLVSELNPERISGKSPLFQVPIVFQPARPASSRGWEIDLFKCHADISKFELSFTFDDTNSSYLCAIEYKTDLFQSDKIQRMEGHFLNILMQICNKELVKDIILPNSEELDSIATWGRVIKPYSLLPAHVMFERCARKNQTRIAVSDKDGKLNYLELNTNANELAYILKEMGIRKGDFIGIYMDRSINMVISILGILKSGAAYVPIDPMYPKERIEYMLQDAQCKLVLTDTKRANIDYKALCVDGVCFGSGKQFISTEPVDLDSPAYCIYTSGSTGRPKGVVLSHRALSNHMNWMIKRFRFNESDIVLQKTPFSFDASVWEFYAPLMIGGQLVMAPVNAHKDINILIDTIRSNKVTILQGVPSWINALAEDTRLFSCESLRMLFSGGEALQMSLVNKIISGKDIMMVNLYGPTETCIDATYWICKNNDTYSVAPIGYPVDNCNIYILDKELNTVPVGIAGELYIGGVQVAIGYHNQTQMTEERFIGFNGDRIYRTGDIVKWDNEGKIHFIGRVDNQIKYHGYRIEFEEIEKAIMSLPFIEKAVVVLHSYQTKLVCYLKGSGNLSKEHIAQQLTRILPSYMIPSVFILVEEFPIMPNGKYDRKALSIMSIEEGIPLILPINKVHNSTDSSIQNKLLQIWKAVLQNEHVSVDDDFYNMGGDSLLSMMVQSMANRQEINILAQDIFTYRTISKLVDHLRIKDQKISNTATRLLSIWSSVLKRSDICITDNFFEIGGDSLLSMMIQSMANREGFNVLASDISKYKSIIELAGYIDSHANGSEAVKKNKVECGQNRLTNAQKYVFEIATPSIDHFCMATYLQLPDSIDISKISQILSSVIETHQSLQLSFDIDNDTCILMKDTPCLELDMVDLNTALNHNALQDNITKHAKLIDVKRGKLIAGSVIVDSSGIKTLLLTAHYLAVDGMSWRIILSEIEDYIQQIQTTGKIIPLKEHNGYLDWCDYIIHKVPQIDSSYWLSNAYENSISLEKDVEGENTLEALAYHVEELNKKETSRLITQATALHSLKITDIFLVALAETFGTNDNMLSINLEGYGRDVEGIDVSNTVGCFTVVYPVLLKKGISLRETIINISKLERMPGVEYSLLRYMSQDETVRNRLLEINKSKISFNYMGIFENNNMLFTRCNNGRRHHYLEIDAYISNEKLSTVWKYCTNIHSPDTIATYASKFISILKELGDDFMLSNSM